MQKIKQVLLSELSCQPNIQAKPICHHLLINSYVATRPFNAIPLILAHTYATSCSFWVSMIALFFKSFFFQTDIYTFFNLSVKFICDFKFLFNLFGREISYSMEYAWDHSKYFICKSLKSFFQIFEFYFILKHYSSIKIYVYLF